MKMEEGGRLNQLNTIGETGSGYSNKGEDCGLFQCFGRSFRATACLWDMPEVQ